MKTVPNCYVCEFATNANFLLLNQEYPSSRVGMEISSESRSRPKKITQFNLVFIDEIRFQQISRQEANALFGLVNATGEMDACAVFGRRVSIRKILRIVIDLHMEVRR